MKVPKVLSNSVIYTGVSVLQQCASFFLLPLYTNYLTPADYGITGVVTSISSLLAIFTTLGISTAANRFYYKYHGEPEYVRRLYGTIGCAVILQSVLFGGIFLIAHKWIIDPLIGNISFYPYVLLGILNVLVAPLYNMFQGYLQTIQNGMRYGINTMAYFLVLVSLTITFIVGFEMGALGVLLAQFVTSVLFFIYVIFAFFKHQKVCIEKSILKDTYKYSLPLLPHTLANWSNGTIDKILVNDIRSESDAGIYNLGRQYSSVANTISVAFNSAYVPWFFDKANDIRTNMSLIRKMSEISVCVMSFLCIIMSLFAQEILDFMISNPAYNDVWRVIPFLLCGIIFNNIYFFYVNVLFLKNTGVIFTITVSTIAINVGLNILLIPVYGYIGCGLANMATFFMKSVIAVIVSMRKNKEIRFRTLYLYIIGIISSAICLVALFMDRLSPWTSVATKAVFVLFVSVCLFFRYKDEFMIMYNSLLKKK